MIRKFDELSDSEKTIAKNRCLSRLVNAIVEGAVRFDDTVNDEPLQARIDAVMEKAESLSTPWFAPEMLMEDEWMKCQLLSMAEADAEVAFYPEVGDVIVWL